jgi:hypothetical protein
MKAITGPIISPAQNNIPSIPMIPRENRFFFDNGNVERAIYRIQIPSRIGMKARIHVTITPAEKPVTLRTWTIWTSIIDEPPR